MSASDCEGDSPETNVGDLKLVVFPEGTLVPPGAHLCSPLDWGLGSAQAVNTVGRPCFALSSGLETSLNVSVLAFVV